MDERFAGRREVAGNEHIFGRRQASTQRDEGVSAAPAAGSDAAIEVLACGSRESAIARFRQGSHRGVVGGPRRAKIWSVLVNRIAARAGSAAASNRAFFMVPMMEAWFLADQPALAAHFGRGFNPRQLPRNAAVEQIPKRDVENRLHDATSDSAKGPYAKGTKGSDDASLLALIDPVAVAQACPHFARLVDFLRARAAGG